MKTVSVIGKYPFGRTLKQVFLTFILLLTAVFCDGKALKIPAAEYGYFADIATQVHESTLAVPDDSSEEPESFLSDFVVLPLALTVPEMPVRRLPGPGRNAHSRDLFRSVERKIVFCGRRDESSFCLFINVISRMYSRSCDYYVFEHQRLLN